MWGRAEVIQLGLQRVAVLAIITYILNTKVNILTSRAFFIPAAFICNLQVYYYYYLLSPLCRVLPIIYLKQTVLLGYVVLQLCSIYNLFCM
jgi:hypothetical protein